MSDRKDRERQCYHWFRERFGGFEAFAGTAPENLLLLIGERVCSTDFAVRFFNKKEHPKFYRNREALERAVRRAWASGAFDHRSQIVAEVEKYFGGDIEGGRNGGEKITT